MENVSDSQSPKFPPFSLSHVMSPSLNPLITQPLSPVAKGSVSKCSVWFQSGDFILSGVVYLKIGPVKIKQAHLSEHKSTNTHTKMQQYLPQLPFPILFHWSQLHCLNTCIFRVVKSAKIPVMNISTALSVINVLFDQSNKKHVLI